MKALLVLESREGKVLAGSYELIAFAKAAGFDFDCFLVGSPANLPALEGKLYLADNASHGDYNPGTHKALILEAAQQSGAERVVFLHSFYGWDLAPRVALALNAAQISEVSGLKDGNLELSCYNAKLRRTVAPTSPKAVITLQAGAFPATAPSGTPQVVVLNQASQGGVRFVGYEQPPAKAADLSKAQVIVSAGRGVGKKENLPIIEALAQALKGEVGCSRPVADNGWMDVSRQVGMTGQTVAPKLYVACGISGAIQHLAGMKGSEFIVAINKDAEAPIADVADVILVGDLLQIVPAVTAKLKG